MINIVDYLTPQYFTFEPPTRMNDEVEIKAKFAKQAKKPLAICVKLMSANATLPERKVIMNPKYIQHFLNF